MKCYRCGNEMLDSFAVGDDEKRITGLYTDQRFLNGTFSTGKRIGTLKTRYCPVCGIVECYSDNAVTETVNQQ